MNTRPGVMIYFDRIRPYLKHLNDTDFKILMEAVFDYAEFGEVPELEGIPEMCFEIMRCDINRDAKEYETKKLKSRYSNYKRWAKEKGQVIISYEDWLNEMGETSEELDFIPGAPIGEKNLLAGETNYPAGSEILPTTETASSSKTETYSSVSSSSESESHPSSSSASEAESESATKTRPSGEPEDRERRMKDFTSPPYTDEKESKRRKEEAMNKLRSYISSAQQPLPH